MTRVQILSVFFSSARSRFTRVRPRPFRARAVWRQLLAVAAGWSLVALAAPRLAAAENQSAWVYPGPDGKLAYKLTPAGDRIMDFSYAGYEGGGVALPLVPTVVKVQPTGGVDDTATIQAGIDRVSGLPMKDGFRGAVVLAPGTFVCAGTLIISASGVVLRGSGSEAGANRSTIKLSGQPHLAIMVRAPDGKGGENQSEDAPADPKPEERAGPAVHSKLADAYVPSGAQSFTVTEEAAELAGHVRAYKVEGFGWLLETACDGEFDW